MAANSIDYPVTICYNKVMKHIATLRVVGKDIPMAAIKLRSVGFDVRGQGKLSIIVEGEGDVFLRNLGFTPPGGYFCRDFVPHNVILIGVVDRIEIAGPVEWLDI